VAEVVAWLHRVDATFSTYKESSDISRYGEIELSDDVLGVLDLADALRCETDGYFDVWATGRLDPSGVVKGWAVERASAMLADAGFGVHCVNAGGDIRARGREWRVGIADPFVAGRIAAVVAVTDGAAATSGIAERGAHVIDPHTGRAALDLASVTVVGPELARADAYATAALAMGVRAVEWLSRLDDHQAVVIDLDGRQTAISSPCSSAARC
jgi:thiamine biosynthesis lipoprotein